MLPGKQYTPADYGAMAWRRRWLIVGPLVLGVYVALIVSARLPSLYQSEMLIQVVPQRVPDAYVRSTVTMRTVDRLSALSEQIMSRTELERLVTDMNLYPNLRATLPMQDVVERMRLQIKVDPVRSGNNQDADSFYVRFSYPAPDIATRVTERLGGLFIDVNARDRGNLAQATNSFLQTQLDEARKLLEEQEGRLKQFRERNAGRLPTQLQFNMTAMQNAQTRSQTLIESLARDRDQKLTLERLYVELDAQEVIAPAAPPPAPAAAPTTQVNPVPTGTTRQALEAAKQQLIALELRLQPLHPDVKKTKALIATLEAKLTGESTAAAAASAAAAPTTTPSTTPPSTAPVLAATPAFSQQEIQRRDRLQQMRAQIESLERQIAFKEGEEQRSRAVVDDLQRRIEQVPGVESEWISLTRDYDTQQTTYRELLTKAEAAKLAANLEQRQIGEQFRILDPARTPVRPTGVNRLEINFFGAVIGFAIGFALAALMELKDRSFRHAADIVSVFSLPVIALVPQMISAADRQRARARRLMASAAVVAVVAVGAWGFWTMQLWKYVV